MGVMGGWLESDGECLKSAVGRVYSSDCVLGLLAAVDLLLEGIDSCDMSLYDGLLEC